MGNVCNNPAPYPTDIPLPPRPNIINSVNIIYKYYTINTINSTL